MNHNKSSTRLESLLTQTALHKGTAQVLHTSEVLNHQSCDMTTSTSALFTVLLTLSSCNATALALKRDDPNWSHSLYCPNWKYVKKFTQQLNAGRSVYLKGVSMIALPMGAGRARAACGGRAQRLGRGGGWSAFYRAMGH